MIRLDGRTGRLALTLTATRMGRDVNVSLFGGEAPHIGAVALAEPRDSLGPGGGRSASCSVLCVCGHKEDELARRLALSLAQRLDARICLACGIHLPDISPEEIGAARVLADQLADQLAARLILGLEGEFLPETGEL